MRITAPISTLLKSPPSFNLTTLTSNAKSVRNLSTNRKKKATPSANESFLESASSYLSSFRLKVASTLSSSLTPSERSQLLNNLKGTFQESSKPAPTKKAEPNTVQRSIGEAVAAAVAKEASNRAQILDSEREFIYQRAERAVLDRVENDLVMQERRVALERWTKDLEEEKQRLSQAGEDYDEEAAVDVNRLGDHAILGPALVDLRYKRVHLVSAKQLSAIPIWEHQRVYRHDRAKVMAKDKLKSLPLGFPGIISLHEATDGTLSILDGQHRVGMLTLLLEKLQDDDDKGQLLEQILVEVFPESTGTINHAKDLFTEINKAEPVKLVDMPGVAKFNDRRIITAASLSLADMYPDMFKPSQRCRPPHLNLDNLRDAIFASKVVERLEVAKDTALVDWLMEQNAFMRERYTGKGAKDDIVTKTISETALRKAVKFDFYLGLDLTWLYR